jgi:uncharacterized repeat protein (TIGR02543 family)
MSKTGNAQGNKFFKLLLAFMMIGLATLPTIRIHDAYAAPDSNVENESVSHDQTDLSQIGFDQPILPQFDSDQTVPIPDSSSPAFDSNSPPSDSSLPPSDSSSPTSDSSLPIASNIQPLADLTISNASELLNLLNATQKSNAQITITTDIEINASDLDGTSTKIQLYNSIITGDKGNNQAVTITIKADSPNPSRGLFHTLFNSMLSNINFLFEGDVNGIALVAELTNGCTISDVNISINGSVTPILFSEIDSSTDSYFASPAFGRISNSVLKDISVVVEKQVGSQGMQNLTYPVMASGFCNVAFNSESPYLVFSNINTTIKGGIYAEGENAVSASGLINSLLINSTTVSIDNNKVTVGTANKHESIISRGLKDFNYNQSMFSAGLIGWIETSTIDSIGQINNNSIQVFGDILQDNTAVLSKLYTSSAAGILGGAEQTNGSLMLDFSNNSVIVEGGIESCGPGSTIASGAITLLTANITGKHTGNSVTAGYIKAASQNQPVGTNTIDNDSAYANGFCMNKSPLVSFYNNAVTVIDTIIAINESDRITNNVKVPSSYASGFSYLTKTAVGNSVTVEGIYTFSLFHSNTAGFAYFVAGNDIAVSRNSVLVFGDLVAIGWSENAVTSGFTNYQYGNCSYNKVDVLGAIYAGAEVLAQAAGFVTNSYATLNDIQSHDNNSVFVARDIQSSAFDGYAYSGGYANFLYGSPRSIAVSNCIVRINGKVLAVSLTDSLPEGAMAGGFANELFEATITDSAVHVGESVSIIADYGQVGSFVSKTSSTTLLQGCTLLAKPDEQTFGGHYKNFVGTHQGTATDCYVVEIFGEKRIANRLSFVDNIWSIQPEDMTPAGIAKIKFTDQLAPGFNYLLSYRDISAGELTWLDTFDQISGSYTAGLLTDYPVFVTTAMSILPHAALISATGIVFDIIGIQDIRPLAAFGVIFDSQGGSTVDAIENLEDSSLIPKPVDPVKEGFDFAGWYTEPDCQTEWDFDADTIEDDLILYAKWIPVEEASGETGNGESSGNSNDAGGNKAGNETSETPKAGSTPKTGDPLAVFFIVLAIIGLAVGVAVLAIRFLMSKKSDSPKTAKPGKSKDRNK